MAFIKSIYVFPIKIADYLIMTVNTINSSVILYMPMWKIIIHLVAISMYAGMDNAGKSRSGIYDVYFCLP